MYDSTGELANLTICLFYGLMCVLIVHPLFVCGRQKAQPVQGAPGQPAPLYISKTCNKKAGLCNDDPDLKSDKLLVALSAKDKPTAAGENNKDKVASVVAKPPSDQKNEMSKVVVSGDKSTDLRSAVGPAQPSKGTAIPATTT